MQGTGIGVLKNSVRPVLFSVENETDSDAAALRDYYAVNCMMTNAAMLIQMFVLMLIQVVFRQP
jgi:hypothetical protein